MGKRKLKNAPLREAIFELTWQSPLDSTGFPEDKEFELALGKFDSAITKNFPVKKKVGPSASVMRVYGRPVYQFWKGNVEWPVIQLGPGVLTVNDTDKTYVWDSSFRPNLVRAIESLKKSYTQLPDFNRLSLKYIDSVDISPDIDFRKFISENLQTTLINEFDIPGKPIGLNINQAFEVDGSSVLLNIQNAINNVTGSHSLVWMTTVEKRGSIEFERITDWLDFAHNITSDLFVKMLKPAFYESFD